jgi:hypothetical protein
MEKFSALSLGKSFSRFEGATAKGHEESIWILNVVEGFPMEKGILKEVFAKTVEPLGWFFSAWFSEFGSREQFDFRKKSAEGGCSWGQVAYAWYFKNGGGVFVEQDTKVYLEWLEKAAHQKNPMAMDWLGDWFLQKGENNNAVAQYLVSAELGWRYSMCSLSSVLKPRKEFSKDWRQAIIWSVKSGYLDVFWEVLGDARRALEREMMEGFDCDFNQVCYSLGWGLFWYIYGTEQWSERNDEEKVFGNNALDFYCSCVELQQESICSFLLFWNRSVGVKDVGVVIGKMVWDGKGDHLVTTWRKKSTPLN